MNTYIIGEIFSESEYNLKERFPLNIFHCINDNKNNFYLKSWSNIDHLIIKLENIKKNNYKLVIVIGNMNMYKYKCIIDKKKILIHPEVIYLINKKNDLNIDENNLDKIKNYNKIEIDNNDIEFMKFFLKTKFNIFNVEFLKLENVNSPNLNLEIFNFNNYKYLWNDILFNNDLINNINFYGIRPPIRPKIFKSDNNYLMLKLSETRIETSILERNINLNISKFSNIYLSLYEIPLEIKYVKKDNNIIIFIHIIFGNDGLALEYLETIDELLIYYSDKYIISVITLSDDFIYKKKSYISKCGKLFYVYELPFHRSYISDKQYLKSFNYYFIKIIKELKPSLAIAAYQTTIVFNYFISLCKNLNIPILIRWSGSSVVENQERLYFEHAVENSDMVIKIGEIIPKLLNNNFKKKIIKSFSVDFSNLKKLDENISISKFNEIINSNKDNKLLNYSKLFNYNNYNKIYATIGRICKNKNQLQIVKAFNKSNKRNNNCLLLIGTITDNEYYELIKKEININNKNNIFQCEVSPNNMNIIYNLINVLIFIPTKGEGMARSLIESFYMNIPAIVDNANNYSYLEYCSEDYCLFTNNDINSIVDKINLMEEKNDIFKRKLIKYHSIFKNNYSLNLYEKIFDSIFLSNDEPKVLYSKDNIFLIDNNSKSFTINENNFHINENNNNNNNNNKNYIFCFNKNNNYYKDEKIIITDSPEKYETGELLNFDKIIILINEQSNPVNFLFFINVEFILVNIIDINLYKKIYFHLFNKNIIFDITKKINNIIKNNIYNMHSFINN